jgi:hypothetical protein
MENQIYNVTSFLANVITKNFIDNEAYDKII